MRSLCVFSQPWAAGVYGLCPWSQGQVPGARVGGCLLPRVDQEIKSPDTTRLEWGWLDQASVMWARVDPMLSRLDSLQLSFLALDSRTGQGMVPLR